VICVEVAGETWNFWMKMGALNLGRKNTKRAPKVARSKGPLPEFDHYPKEIVEK